MPVPCVVRTPLSEHHGLEKALSRDQRQVAVTACSQSALLSVNSVMEHASRVLAMGSVLMGLCVQQQLARIMQQRPRLSCR
jgi:hypothetical protein